MADDTIALELEGSGFQLDDLDALQHFGGLLRELAADAAGGAAITWELRSLRTGSLVAEVKGTAEDQDAVHRVAAAYDCVGAALAVGDPVPYSDAVSVHADRLTSLINGRVEALRFRDRWARSRSSPCTHDCAMEATPRISTRLERLKAWWTLWLGVAGRGSWCIPTKKGVAFPAT